MKVISTEWKDPCKIQHLYGQDAGLRNDPKQDPDNIVAEYVFKMKASIICNF